jgi:hypothetical protein
MNYKLFLLFLPLVFNCAFAQPDYNRKVVEAFFQSTAKTSIDSTVVQAALYFLDVPYAAGTLDSTKEESLVVNLREMDCTTFVENCLALSRTMQLPVPDYNSFEQELRQIRYRKGLINGYTSRLHYTTDWIFDNVEKGIIEDITYALGGRKFKPNVYYMSENYRKYPHLVQDSLAVQQIKFVEQKINARSNYYCIPKKEIAWRQSLIKNGDILCFTTSIPGLDVSHIAIAYWRNGELTFIHASSKARKVIVNPQSLIDYCSMIQTCTGIIVLRPVNIVPGSE